MSITQIAAFVDIASGHPGVSLDFVIEVKNKKSANISPALFNHNNHANPDVIISKHGSKWFGSASVLIGEVLELEAACDVKSNGSLQLTINEPGFQPTVVDGSIVAGLCSTGRIQYKVG